jgi:hypothetical protein
MRHCLALLGQRTFGRLCLFEGLTFRLVFAFLMVFTDLWGIVKMLFTSVKVVTKSNTSTDVLPPVVVCGLMNV